MESIILGLKTHYEITGDGEPIVILHGWGANLTTMQSITNLLQSQYRVIAIDMPGFGESEEPKDVWSSYDFADHVEALLNHLGIDRFHILGHSHGGRVSIILASKYPERIGKMILVDSAGLVKKKSFKVRMKILTFKIVKRIYLALTFWDRSEAKMERFYRRFGSSDYKASPGIMRRIMVRVLADDLRPLLSKIQASTLIIWGNDDMDTPVEMGRIMEGEIPDAGLVVFEQAGHYSFLDQMGRFQAVMRVFMKMEEGK
jgi:pimeloyl-ACP methyl ester carboxylesterase